MVVLSKVPVDLASSQEQMAVGEASLKEEEASLQEEKAVEVEVNLME